MKGLGSSWFRSKEPLVYCSAWAFVLSSAGATANIGLEVGCLSGGWLIYISFLKHFVVDVRPF